MIISISKFLKTVLAVIIFIFGLFLLLLVVLFSSVIDGTQKMAAGVKQALFPPEKILVDLPLSNEYYSIWITAVGPEKIKIIKLLRERYQDSLPLAEAVTTLTQLPILYLQSTDRELIQKQAEKLIELQASFIIKAGDSVISSN